jgi:D-lactate dehydrogenase (cytochrome)
MEAPLEADRPADTPHEAAAATPLELDPALAGALRDLLGTRFSTAPADREHHGRGESYHAVQPPQAVCRALSTGEVSSIVKLCKLHRTPVIAFGAGTSLEGHVAARRGGVCIDLGGMTRIVAVRPEDLDCTVEAGVTRHQLNAHLRDTGLFFPVDPGAECTIGGMAATRASGTNAVRYGTMRENVISLTVVLADGDIIRTSSRARKSSAGYDLTRLFVGSEGTLGIITEVTIRLYGVPEAMASAVCSFGDMGSAVAAVTTIIQYGIPVARVEFLDGNAMRANNKYSGLSYREVPTLFFEFHGSEASVAEQAELVKEIVADNGGAEFQWASDPESRAQLWRARHNIHYAIMGMRPNGRVWSTDVCVPISALTRCMTETQPDLEAASFFIATVGHVGDGNFHLGLCIDPNSAEEMAEAEALNERLVRRAIALDGTCTGEHGIGYGKAKFMTLEHGDGVRVMRAIKQALDPDDILNPGKILPVLS